MSLLIKNCRLVSPGVDLRGASLEIQGACIRRVWGPDSTGPECDNELDATGLTVLPGFIDMHFHGAMGCDATDGTRESLETIAEAKLAEGVTSICPATLTLPEEKLTEAFRAAADYLDEQSFARLPGMHLEGPFISPECPGAQNPAYVRQPDQEEVLRLNAIAPVAIVSYAVESEGGIEFTKALADAGIVPSCGHSAAKYSDFVSAKAAGLRQLTHFCNQMTGLHHREIGLVGAGLLDDEIGLEVICDKIHLCPEMIKLIFKNKPVDRIFLITDAIAASGLPDGNYELGGLPVEVSDGVARLTSNGALAGSTLRMNVAMKNAHVISGLPLSELCRTVSLNQAELLGLDRTGKIQAGYFADLVLMDNEFNPVNVFVHGERKF